MDDSLRSQIPDPEERRRVVEAMLDQLERTGSTRGEPGGPTDLEDLLRTGRRFHGETPLWFPHAVDGTLLWNDHTPSAFGHWFLARVVAKTGGRYVFYPFPPGRWLDPCPRDEALLARLAPELGTRKSFAHARSGDPALAALCRAAALVTADTPWSDTYGSRLARGWSSFDSVSPLVQTGGFRLRRKPFDLHLVGGQQSFHQEGQRLADLLPRYDRAIEALDHALSRIRAGEDVASHPRSVADLRLGRFWFALSAFHLEALSIYLREWERFVPPGFDDRKHRLVVTYLRAIRMSDCLDAYDGRVLSDEAEAGYRRDLLRHVDWDGGPAPAPGPPPGMGPSGGPSWAEREVVPGQQGNVLDIPEGSPDYRAKRSRVAVIRYLDRRLVPRALDLIRAAEGVMADHAKTPWGWTTYYTDAFTFVFEPVPRSDGRSDRPGGESSPDEPPPWSPTPRDGGGSSAGGPVTR
jgi:hypothetical protein